MRQLRRLRGYVVLVGIGLFVYLLASLDLRQIWVVLSSAHPAAVALAAALTPVEIVLKGVALWALVSLVGAERVGFGSALRAAVIGLALGSLTPGKVGDFLKVFALQTDTGLGIARTLAAVAQERVLTLLSLLLLAVVGVVGVAAQVEFRRELWLAIIPGGALALGLGVVIMPGLPQRALRPVYAFSVPAALRARAAGGFDDFYAGVAAIMQRRARLLGVFALLALTWLVVIVRDFLFSQAIGLGIALPYFLLISPIVAVVSLVPISIMGVGTRDYTLVFLLSTLGLSAEQAVSQSLLGLTLATVPTIAAGYLVAWWSYLRRGEALSLPLAAEKGDGP